jgi:hypothetical protein
MDEYYIKYLKYKNKYLELKQYGGVRFNMFSKLTPGVVREDNPKKKSNIFAVNANEKTIQDALIKAQQEEKEANALVYEKSVKTTTAYEAWKNVELYEKDALDKEKDKVTQRVMGPIINNANINFTNTNDRKKEIEKQNAVLQKIIAKEWAILERTMMVNTNKAYQVLNNAQLEEKEARLNMKKKAMNTKKLRRELRNATKMINMANKIAAKCNKAVKISRDYVNNSQLMHKKLANAKLEEKKAIFNLDAKKIETKNAQKELNKAKLGDKIKATEILKKAELAETNALEMVKKTRKKIKRHLRHAVNATKMAETAIMIAEKCIAKKKS